jgi:hypothetical protein
MSMVCLHVKFYLPHSSGSLVITIRMRATENIRMTYSRFISAYHGLMYGT